MYEALDAMQPSLVDLSLTRDAIACNDDDGHSGLLFETYNAAVRQWVHSKRAGGQEVRSSSFLLESASCSFAGTRAEN